MSDAPSGDVFRAAADGSGWRILQLVCTGKTKLTQGGHDEYQCDEPEPVLRVRIEVEISVPSGGQGRYPADMTNFYRL